MIAEQKRKPNEFIQNNANYFSAEVQEQSRREPVPRPSHCSRKLSICLSTRIAKRTAHLPQPVRITHHRINPIEGEEIKAGERISEQIKLAIVVRALPRSLIPPSKPSSPPTLAPQSISCCSSHPPARLHCHESLCPLQRLMPPLKPSPETRTSSDHEPETLDSRSPRVMQHSNKQRNKGPRTRQPRSANGAPGGADESKVRMVNFSFLDETSDGLPLSDDLSQDPFFVPDENTLS